MRASNTYLSLDRKDLFFHPLYFPKYSTTQCLPLLTSSQPLECAMSLRIGFNHRDNTSFDQAAFSFSDFIAEIFGQAGDLSHEA